MTLDEAIKHAEEVAEKNEEECESWAYGASQINDDENRKKQYQKHAEMWRECAEEHRQLAEWFKELKQLREQQSCENSIVEWKKDFKGYVNSLSMPRDDYNGIMEYIDELPVTPQTKTREWIFVDKAHEHAHCSECDYGDVDLMNGRPHNYCPNCGAKMVEPQEGG